MDCTILRNILVQGFCSPENEIARFPIEFRLNSSSHPAGRRPNPGTHLQINVTQPQISKRYSNHSVLSWFENMYRLCSNFSLVIFNLIVTVGTSKKLAAMLLCKFEEEFMKVIMTSPDTAEKFRHLLRLNIKKAKQMSSNENFISHLAPVWLKVIHGNLIDNLTVYDNCYLTVHTVFILGYMDIYMHWKKLISWQTNIYSFLGKIYHWYSGYFCCLIVTI